MVKYGPKISLVVEGVDTRVEDSAPWEIIHEVTSYFVPGHQFSPRYRSGLWDGRKKLFSLRTRKFPSGLTSFVKKALEDEGYKVSIDDQRNMPPLPVIDEKWFKSLELNGINFDYPFDYQPEIAWRMLEAKRGIADLATNAGKTVLACLITAALRLPTLFIVPGKELLYQTRNVFKKRLNLTDEDVGIIGDGKWIPGKWITIATVASLYRKLKKPDTVKFLDTIQLLFSDECHTVPSDTFYFVMRFCDAFFRYGLSGTPLKRTDGADLRLIGATGPVIASIRNKDLIERGVSNKVEIQFLKITKPDNIHPKTPYPDVYKLGVVENIYRNKQLCEKICEFVGNNRQVVVLVKEIDHGQRLDKALWTFRQKEFITHQFINGQESTEIRQKALKDYEKGDLKVLIATAILNQGIDIPNIDALVMAGGGKSSIQTLQRVGRGIRKGGAFDTLIVLDTADLTHRYLTEHSLQRLKDYKNEDCFDIRVF